MPISTSATGPVHTPYAEDWINGLYNRLFCDRPQDMQAQAGTPAAPWQAALCGPAPDLRAAAAIVADRSAESRVRLLACHVLRAHGSDVPTRELLGVVIEVPLEGSLDTLAAYVDGSVRYLHHSGKVEMVEPMAALLPLVKQLAEASAAVVSRIGPWDKPRLPAPRPGNIRLSFLVSDGLYFGEGDMQVMMRDGMAGPIIAHATELMQAVIALARKRAA
ncbi:MAG: hypothetical protein QM722_05040 [Piscinibacter sp.]